MSLFLKNVTKNFTQGAKTIEVLKKLNLEVIDGDIVAIIGPSGSGKSTLLSLLAGLEPPQEGQILVNNTPLYQISEPQRIQFRGEKIGIVFQQFHLMSHLTALENVMLPLEINNRSLQLSSVEMHSKSLSLLRQMGLEDRKDHWPYQLSGGEAQRVAIARALVIEPELLLADEPSGSLDESTGKVVVDLLFSVLREKKITSVFVTHSAELARRCHRIYQMQGGTLHQVHT